MAMFSNRIGRRLMALALSAAMLPATAAGAEVERKVLNKVKPIYPELARQMSLSGTVRIEVIIAADGSVKSLKPLGGHPLLIRSASEALKKWRYVPGPETTTIVEFQFHRE